ncbi:MAG TPA: carboxypeptidase regulatory-like domain-containing protein, partial [Candidatus Acidoferrum sp.]|nr:carboxypeptidase regulatory-like domain-containing protein [Candidatus Acidoferrum sp.]
MNTKLRYIALFFAITLALVWCIPSVGQVVKGSISGSVTDPQGAVVSGAQVKAKNVETGVVSTTTTDSAGLYRFNLIPVGTYTVEIASQGFKTASQSNVQVGAGRDTGLGSIRIAVGETSTTVEVTGDAPLIETTQAQVTNTFSGTTLTSFAGVQENEGLDNLALFVPGVSGSRSNNFSNSNGGGGFTVQGLRGRNNDQQVDGQNNNDNSVGGPGLFLSDPDFVQQYVLVTNQFGPEYGRNAGSVVNIVTKSGGNAWHGSAFGTEGNSYLNAMTNTQKRFGVQPGSVSPTNPQGSPLTGPPRSNDEFTGFTIGGPIIKNKAFVFGGFDDELISQTAIFQTSGLTPTPAGLTQLTGCFPTGAGAQAVAALSQTGPYGVTQGNPTPFLGKNPAPTLVAVTGCGTVPMAGVVRTLSAPFHGYDFVAKGDITLGSNSFTTRYLYNLGNTFNAASSGTAAAAAGYPNDVPALSQLALVSWTHNFSSRMVNETRVSFGRLGVVFGGNSLGTVPLAANLPNAIANISFNSSALLGWGPATNIPQSRLVNTWQAQDNWNYVLGKHNFKSGVNWTYQRTPNIFLPAINGQFRFTNWSSFFADTPNRVQIAEGPSTLDFREYDTFLYFGDDWKIGRNLTLNLGLTWSYYGQPANLFNSITTPRESNPATAFWNPALPKTTTTFPIFPTPKNSFGPSAGFAYSPQWGGFLTGRGKTTFRGGYRMLYDPPFYNIYINMSSSAPQVFLQTFTGAPNLAAGQFGLPANASGASARNQLQSQLQKGVFDPNTFSQTSMSPNFGPDKVHSWSFGIEREITKAAVVEVRYAGNHGLNLFQSIDGNPFVANLKADYPNLVPANVTPCATTAQVGPFLAGSGAPNDIGRVNCGPGVLRIRNNGAGSDYHGVQVEFRANNLFKQLTLRTGFAFSKTTDNVSEIFGTGSAGTSSAFAQNPLDTTTGEHSLSGLDFPKRWTLIAVEELPFFKEQHGLMGHVLGGWRISADYIVGSGQTFTPLQIGEARATTGRNYYDTAFLNAFNVTSESARP